METRDGEGKERMRCVDRVPWKLTSPYVYTTGCQRGFAVWFRELKQGLCNNLEGWDGVGAGREVQEEGDIHIPMANSYWFTAFSSFECIPRSWISGSYGNAMFNVLRNHHTVSHRNCSVSHSHQQCTRVLMSLCSCQHCFSDSSHPSVHEVVYHWSFQLSLMISDVRVFFHVLLVIVYLLCC